MHPAPRFRDIWGLFGRTRLRSGPPLGTFPDPSLRPSKRVSPFRSWWHPERRALAPERRTGDCANQFRKLPMAMEIPELFTRYQAIIRPVLRIGPVFGGIAMLAWRVRETRVPVIRPAIVIPPLAMSSAFGMFFSPAMRVPWSWGISAFVVGALVLSWPLVRSSRLELRDGVVFMKRSRTFLAILLVLLGVRLALHDYIGHIISPLQTASLFYLLAFGMIVRWRVQMYQQYERITRAPLEH